MKTSKILSILESIRDDLAEARRYVRGPSTVEKPHDITVRANVESATLGFQVLDSAIPADDREILKRTRANLWVACDALLVCPVAIEGAIDLARWELTAMMGRAEKAEEGSAR